MVATEDFAVRTRNIAERFLQTAVVVDDEAFMSLSGNDDPPSEINVPDRHTRGTAQHRPTAGRGSQHTLNATAVIDSFAGHGVICGVVGPNPSTMEIVKQADIVVLDWRLKDEDPDFSLNLLLQLVTEVDLYSLRLVAFYTGEAALEDIYRAVFEALERAGLDPLEDRQSLEISYRHGRVVLYAKPDVQLAVHLRERRISEGDLPGRLVEDFSGMTEGLLPSIALTSLSAVRECAHMVLDRFNSDLDPAFMTHRACLPNPEDAERQIVNHVAEELRGLMDNAVAGTSPAGDDVVEGWLRRRNDGTTPFVFGDRSLDVNQTIILANRGIKASALPEGAFRSLSAGFAGGEVVDLDERLAWIMSSRTVFNAPPPTLWLGSVVTGHLDEGEKHLVCMRPRCDSVRLKLETEAWFFFLPLVEPTKVKEQVIVKLGSQYVRLGIGLDPAGWVRRKFKPTVNDRPVTATTHTPDGEFVFFDTCGKRFTWRGELRTEYAQRLAQTFSTTLSGVAVDESEWLRRTTRSGN